MASGRKNYFRHSFQARNDDKINDIIDKFGLSGYFYYFALIELCAEKNADEPQEKFIFHQRTLIKELRCHKNKLKVFLEYSASISLLTYKWLPSSCQLDANHIKNRVEVCIPKLLKYMGKYQVKSSSNVSNKRKEKKIKEKESKENKKTKKIPENILECFYDAYPRKIGKKRGFEILQKILISDQDHENVLMAIKNYARHCEVHQTQKQFIQHFSTFLNGKYLDWINADPNEFEPLQQKTYAQIKQDNLMNMDNPYE